MTTSKLLRRGVTGVIGLFIKQVRVHLLQTIRPAHGALELGDNSEKPLGPWPLVLTASPPTVRPNTSPAGNVPELNPRALMTLRLQTGAATMENSMAVPQKLKIEPPYDPASPLLSI